MTFSLAKQHYYSAGTHVFVPGDDALAEREATMALDTYEHGPARERCFSDEAGARTELAIARAHLGDVDGVRDVLEPVLALSPYHRLNGIIDGLTCAHRALSATAYQGSRAARDLREQIEEFNATPVAALMA